MRLVGVVLLAAMLSACTSVKMVQRDGCWIKRTEKIFGRVREEIGPCSRPQPTWVQDQLTRLVQECVAQADYRWQVRALEAWSKAKPYPAQPPQEEILRTCMQEARVGLVAENDELKRRVTELASERSDLRTGSEQDRAQLRASHDRIAEWLGQAAQKPAGTATATASATSDGTATNENGATLASGSTSGAGAGDAPPILPVQSAAAAPRPGDAPKATPASPADPRGPGAPPSAEPPRPAAAASAPKPSAAPPAPAVPAKPAVAARAARTPRPAKASPVQGERTRDVCEVPCAKPDTGASAAETGTGSAKP
jgi:hypothetical protein